jgi:hypothetical protein
MSDAALVAEFRFLQEAQLAASALEAAGIECELPDRMGHGRTPRGIFTGQTFRLIVAAEDVDRAREILASDAVPSNE